MVGNLKENNIGLAERGRPDNWSQGPEVMPVGGDRQPNTHAIHHNNNKYILTNMEENEKVLDELPSDPTHKP